MRFASIALAMEAVLIAGIICVVPYTEIDWRAYMEEVTGFLDGELDYRQLKGGTGPLVYPGGFVWIYSVLYYFTKLGQDIQVAQWIFAGVYLFTLGMMLRFYTRAGLTWKVMLPLFISKRVRSLYVLRLFNDCWAMLFLVVALTLIAGVPRRHGRRARNWVLGCFFFSFAVSIKMNVLLFAPGMLYVMLRTLPLTKVIGCLSVCATWQVLAGLPFLLHDAEAYLTKGFELGRVFTQRWSVNYQFLDHEVFVSPQFGMALLAATVATWVLVWRTRWARRVYLTATEAKVLRPTIAEAPHRTAVVPLHDAESAAAAEERAAFVATVLTFFESNLIGVVFARSLHYQFYTWFFFSIPFVLSYTAYPRMLRLVTFALIRQGFEQYPPTPRTSLMLQGGFALALLAVLFFGRDAPRAAKAAAQHTHADTSTSDETELSGDEEEEEEKNGVKQIPRPIPATATATTPAPAKVTKPEAEKKKTSSASPPPATAPAKNKNAQKKNAPQAAATKPTGKGKNKGA